MLRQRVRVLAVAGLLLTIGGSGQIAMAAPAGESAAANPAGEQSGFDNFLHQFRATALAAGISPETYDRATSGIALNSRIEELNEKQPEFVRPIWEYLDTVITTERVARGRELIRENQGLLQRFKDRYGISPGILAAVWGIETRYGSNLGTFNLIEALANLAYEGPRTDYGRTQLIAALKIAQEQHIDPARMTGSWAGAFGQTQFIPTTFLKYAVDGDGDGRIDLWNSPADALASTANYLDQSGWRAGEPWGEEVRLPDNFPYAEADFTIHKPLSEWAQLGVRSVSGKPLPADPESASIILPAGHHGPAFLVLNNFNVLLKYNTAIPYALAVALLADRVKGSDGVRASWPTGEQMALDQSSAVALQQALTELGFSTGTADGVFGARTRQAIRGYQQARGLPADGFPSSSLIARVFAERQTLAR